jgi:hypothetical protein
MVIFILLTIGLLAFVGAVCFLLAKAIRSDSWSHDAYSVWIGADVTKLREE